MKLRILIVDDEPAIADAIRYVLETDGFETLSLSEGSPVLPLLQSERIDLIVLDVGLPDINGFDLCREIRKI
ncbi:MAG: two-component system response regulator CreB, partial [Deltaproteobacteria bacterium HGW-Deltaproteobacteria-1]